MIDKVLDIVLLELGLGEDIGVTNSHGAGGNSGQALARAVTRTGDDDVGVLVHELLGSGLNERLERRSAVIRHLTRDILGSSRAGSGALGSGSGRVAATSKAKAGHGGNTASKTQELTTRARIVEHGSPFANIPVRTSTQMASRSSSRPMLDE